LTFLPSFHLNIKRQTYVLLRTYAIGRYAVGQVHVLSSHGLVAGFSYIATSITAPFATGRSLGQLGLAAARKRRLLARRTLEAALASHHDKFVGALQAEIGDRQLS
jgi:hypothetical protein